MAAQYFDQHSITTGRECVADKRSALSADNLSEAGWSWGRVSAVDSRGQTIFVADAHRDDGKPLCVRMKC